MSDNKKPERKTLIVIEIDEKGNTYVHGPLKEKKLCIKHLCEVINIVTNLKPSLIQKPKFINKGAFGGRNA